MLLSQLLPPISCLAAAVCFKDRYEETFGDNLEIGALQRNTLLRKPPNKLITR